MAVGLTAATSLGVLLLLIRIGQGRGDGCVTDCSSSTEFQKGDVEYLLPEGGYQAIIPGMEFTCYGYITSWRALAVLDERFSILTHSIYFQVWRPVSETERTYRRVDDDYLLFSPSSEELNNLDTETLPESDIAFLTFEAKRGETDRRMYFQPGDIVGFFIPNFASSVAPLGITFRNASHTTPPDAAVDMYSYTSGQQLCDLSECGQNVTVYRSILPQISVNYEEVSPSSPTPTPMVSACSQAVIEPCQIPTSQSTPSNTPTESPTDVESSGIMIPRIAWIIGGVLVLLLFILVIIVIVLAVVVAFHKGKRAARRHGSSNNSSSLGIVTPYASANLLGYAYSEASVKKTDNVPYPGVAEMRYTPLTGSNFGNGIYRGGADTNSDTYSRRTSESPPVSAETDAYRTATDSIRESFITGSTSTSPPSLVSETGPYRGVTSGSRSNEPYRNAVGNGVHSSAIETRHGVYSPYRNVNDMRNEPPHVPNPPGTSAIRSNAYRQLPDQRHANPLGNIQETVTPWYMGSRESYLEEEV